MGQTARCWPAANIEHKLNFMQAQELDKSFNGSGGVTDRMQSARALAMHIPNSAHDSVRADTRHQ